MAAGSEHVILFDIPSRNQTPWSFNPWKTRFLLNYKGIPHKTEWVEYPDIRGRLEGHVAPGPDKEYPYTCPTIRLPSGEYIMDSKVIAAELERLYPNPSLPGVDHPSYTRVLEIMRFIINKTFGGIFVPLVPVNILSEKSQKYWYETRTRNHGDLATLRKEKGGKIGWEKTEPGFKQATELYLEDKSGPFIQGKEVSYGDFVWAGFLLFLKALGEYDDEESGEKVNVWEEFLKRSGEGGKEVHEGLLKAVEPWLGVP
ncbi:hypothetical protein V8F20_002493 [Naviculisporaceae sp. PSN 640]